MQYINNATSKNASQTNEVSTQIKFVAPTGVVTTSTVSGYAEGAQELTSISGEEKTAIVETVAPARNTNFSMNVINNYNNTIENISILGRTNFKGNTDIVTGKDLGSTINMPLTSNISVNNIESSKVKTYYSTNANATKDLNETSNGWTTSPENLAEVKSYLIVLENTTLNTAEAINFNYTAEIPANLQHNEASYETYAVYFNNNLQTGTTQERAIATKTGIATSTGPVSETKLSSNIEGNVEVPTGKFIKYTLTVTNTGKQVAENVVAGVDLPSCVTYVEFADQEGEGYYTQDTTRTKLNYEFGNIAVGETKTQTFWVIVNNLTVEDICKDQTHYAQGEYQGKTITYHKSEFTHTDTEYKTQIGVKAVINATDLEKQIETAEVKNTVKKAYFKIEAYTRNEGASKILSEGEKLEYNYRVGLYDYNRNVENTTVTMVIPEGLTYQDATISIYDVDTKESTYDREGITYDEQTRTLTINSDKIIKGTIQITTIVDALPQSIYEKQIEATITVKAEGIAEETSNSYKYEITNTGGRETDVITLKTKIPEQLQYIITTVEIDDYKNSYYGMNEGNVVQASFSLQKGQTAKVTINVIAKELEENATVTSNASISSNMIGTLTSNTITHTIEKAVYPEPEDSENPQIPEENTRRIAGQVWKDKNKDGVKDIDEEPVENVTVLLFDKTSGNLVTDGQGNRVTQVTNADGIYEFAGIKQGTYTVIFLYDVANYSATTYHAEKVDETKNSDGIDTEITLDGEKRIAAITEQITISDKNIYNIDIGLVENPKFDLKLDKTVSKITVQDSTGTY